MKIEEFAELMAEFKERYAGYEVVICLCPRCTKDQGPGKYREDDWAVNHAIRKIYL